MFSMGAINMLTNKHEQPTIASKTNKYKCPDCDKEVILKKGNKNKHHFSHYKSINPCFYFEKPSETQIHKEGKLLMKNLLDEKKKFSIKRECSCCNQSETICNEIEYNEIV